MIQRTKNHLPCGFRFQAFDFLNRKHLVIQRTGTLTTQPFNIREKRSGEYQGTLTVTMLMGTQTP
ncbi:hypothetical protein GNT72_20920 [Salmonella enterica]|nr:hypothetical protein [Salmonella enterica subsp. enterica serovar Rubislaw]EBR4476126.1 hypothetical protein [Salmonella enterica]EBO3242586.1 hypothetical protein [Salmonella enterica subsp. enterica serovar Rubislaw]EBT5149116.1 hypothetical protein [Salmonella enterica]EBU0327955.1 hypothetical protein [Salmonella enterica]